MSPIAAGLKKKLMDVMSEKNHAKFLPEGWTQSKWEEFGLYSVIVLKKGKETIRIGFIESGSGMGYYASAHGLDIGLLGDPSGISEEAKMAFDRVVRYFLDSDI
jgi:hypothetical protein